MRILKYIPLMLLLIVASCKQTEKKETPKTMSEPMKEVMAVHDEVMPKMMDIKNLASELEGLADSTEAGTPYRLAIQDLKEANKSMMDWMKGFNDSFDYEEIHEGKELSAEKQELLKTEMEKVTLMRDKVNHSIEQAQQLLVN